MTPPDAVAASAEVGLRARARALFRRLAAERTTPREVALSVCVGVVVGTTPLWGGHTLLAIALASLLRLNRVIAVLASSYSIPPLVPLVAFGAMQIGRLVLTGEPAPMSYRTFASDPVEFGLDWLVGSPILGLLIGAPMGLAAAIAVARIRRRAAPDPTAP